MPSIAKCEVAITRFSVITSLAAIKKERKKITVSTEEIEIVNREDLRISDAKIWNVMSATFFFSILR